ncbi:IPTL-CTERM sorting domain-containing protein [Ottowia sp.]|nr:IPTL-CTERM sorting domain-containing protein [Ottowia sp.]HOB67552.1 IPTL-CTERM sorting domain-containing protein [Ottowia sp.]HPZ57212.1 IPTL-CTERM sorting domain-containing protein [Ottowia sp.]HQD46833.1 IPTL-CTERM sorting domain-containing protein [Ottowia sp.]
MFSKFRWIGGWVVGACLALAGAQTQAATLSYAVSTPVSNYAGSVTEPTPPAWWTEGQRIFIPTPVNQTLAVPQFNPALGTLTAVRIKTRAALQGTITLALGSTGGNASETVTGTSNGRLRFTLPLMTQMTSSPAYSFTADLTPNTAATSPDLLADEPDYNLATVPSSAFAAYLGSGTWSARVTGGASFEVDDANQTGQSGGSQVTRAWAAVVVEYDYTPAPIDLTLAKTLTSTGPYVAGSTATFKLAASNLGPGTAQPAIVVKDMLPTGLQFVSATGTDWTCGAAGQVVTCTRSSTAAELASGDAASPITVTAKVAAGASGTLTNVAYVAPAADETATESNLANGYDDGNPATGSNNDASAALTVTPSIDLTLAKTLTSTGPYAVGSTATFSLVASNRGPDTAQPAIVVQDTLPTGLQFVSATGTDWTCTNAGQVVTCTRSATAAALANGATARPITLTTKVAAGASGTLTSTAYVAPAANETAIETNLANGYEDGSPLTGSNNDASAGLTVAAVTPPAPVPTLNEWALMLLGLLAWGTAALRLRRGV